STPKDLEKYAALLANSAIIEIITTSACILTIPRQITSLSEFILIFYGPCTMIGAPLCWACVGVLEIRKRLHTLLTLLYFASASPIVFACCIFMQRRIFSYLNNNQ
ncbi:hypothetical protein PMAYCL1PPCAC_26031, partial [Pristionchus mayeri]